MALPAAGGWVDSNTGQQARCHVLFHKEVVRDPRASDGYTVEVEVLNDDGSIRIEKKRYPGAGREVHKEVDYIRKYSPGDAGNVVDREILPSDLEEHPQEWARYQQGLDQMVTGTPIVMLPGLSPSTVKDLEHFHVRTVEQLAALPDVHAQKFTGFTAFRQMAREWLAAKEKNAPMEDMRKQLQERDHELQAMRERMEALEKQMNEQAKDQARTAANKAEARARHSG